MLPNKKRTVLKITLQGGAMFAEVATKSLRRAITTIAEHGADSVIVFVEGKLSPVNILQDAGLVSRLKTPAPDSARQLMEAADEP